MSAGVEVLVALARAGLVTRTAAHVGEVWREWSVVSSLTCGARVVVPGLALAVGGVVAVALLGVVGVVGSVGVGVVVVVAGHLLPPLVPGVGGVVVGPVLPPVLLPPGLHVLPVAGAGLVVGLGLVLAVVARLLTVVGPEVSRPSPVLGRHELPGTAPGRLLVLAGAPGGCGLGPGDVPGQ